MRPKIFRLRRPVRSYRHMLAVTLGLSLAGLTSVAAHAVQLPPTRQAAPDTVTPQTPIKKFSTDETLRKGMSHIAAQLTPLLPEIQAGRLQSPAYRTLAKQVEQQTGEIVKNCKLDARADHAFHEILTDLNQSIALMQRDKAEIQRTGALALMQALRNYARYFDHPGWTGPQPQ